MFGAVRLCGLGKPLSSKADKDRTVQAVFQIDDIADIQREDT